MKKFDLRQYIAENKIATGMHKEKKVNEVKKPLTEAFSRQHFVAIAKIIKNIPDSKTRDMVCGEFLTLFRNDNASFDERRFKDAAGVK